LIAEFYGAAGDEVIEDFARHRGHYIFIAHDYFGFVCFRLQIPPLHSADTVGILKLPFEVTLPLVGGDYYCQSYVVVLQFSGDANFLPHREIWCAGLDFEVRVHLCAVPERHALRNKEDEDFVRRSGDLRGQFDPSHCADLDFH